MFLIILDKRQVVYKTTQVYDEYSSVYIQSGGFAWNFEGKILLFIYMSHLVNN